MKVIDIVREVFDHTMNDCLVNISCRHEHIGFAAISEYHLKDDDDELCFIISKDTFVILYKNSFAKIDDQNYMVAEGVFYNGNRKTLPLKFKFYRTEEIGLEEW